MKIVVHLGFPKTGSSTMQYGPLMDLENMGALNLRTWRKNDANEHLEFRPSSRLFLHKDILPEYLDFDESRLNVLSDESFTAPSRLRQCNFGDGIEDPIKFPKRIKQQILTKYPDKVVDIVWLGVIRNQSSLIQSQYVEEYNWKRYKGIDLLFNNKGEIDLDGYEVYHYSEYIRNLECVAGGDHVKFILYEQLQHNPKLFFRELDNCFDAPDGFFEAGFIESHVNRKVKSSFGTFTKKNDYFVPKMAPNIGNRIAEYFYETNGELSQYFDRTELIRYGYIGA